MGSGSRTVMMAILGGTLIAGGAAAAPKAMPPQQIDPSSAMANMGTGFGVNDFSAMADQVVRDLFQRPDIMNSPKPPRIILDGSRILNKSSQRLDTDMIADRLRAQLIRSAQGRLRFLSRENLDIVAEERELKREGQTDVGTKGLTRAVMGADYRLVGRITSQDARSSTTGVQQRSMQIVFELIDLESTETIYISEPYVTVRAQRDFDVYR